MNSLALRFFWMGLLVVLAIGVPAERWLNQQTIERLSGWLAPQLSSTINRDRIRIDQSLKNYRGLVKVMVKTSQAAIGAKRVNQTPASAPVAVRKPDWLLPVSTWRGLIQPDLFLWVDQERQLREYMPLSRAIDTAEVVQQLQQEMGRLIDDKERLHLTRVLDHPVVIASAPAEGNSGWLIAFKIIDNRLLNKIVPPSLKAISVSVLIDQERGQIVASNRPQQIAAGESLDALERNWIIEGVERFDYGNTEISLRYSLLFPREAMTGLVESVMDPQRPVLLGVILLPLLLLSFLAVRKLRQVDGVTDGIVKFATHEIGEGVRDPLSRFRGDSLERLGEVVNYTMKEVRQLRQRLEESNSSLRVGAEQAQQANIAKDEFLASMSHELRTPLTSIIGYCDLLMEDIKDKGQQKQLNSIRTAGRNQLALVNDILDMSKIDSGKFTIESAPYDLRELLNELKQMFMVQATDAGINFVLDQQQNETHLLEGDAQRISQVLINLIGNAIKFTAQGEVRLTVRVDSGQLLFQVKDSGIGMSVAMVEKLFQRFHQADSSISRRFGGSGLGLYISQNLADLMGGGIEVSSEEGVGSTFQLSLPYRKSDIPLQDRNETSSAVLDKQLSGRVLIAEDTLELQLLEKRILESVGLEVSMANNGQEAVDQVNQNHFDLVLMDMQMPVMDGIEATQILRREGHTLPIIALTANVMQKHRDAFEKAGCSGFIGKPIDKAELRKLLKYHLHREHSGNPEDAAEEVDDELMAIFKESAGHYNEMLKRALARKEWNELRSTAHTLKGSAASFGFSVISSRAAAIQTAIDEEQLEAVPQLTMELLAELGAIL